MKTAFLSLGSNLGDRAQNLRRAIELLASPKLLIQRVSPVYETEPVGLADQPMYLNAAIEIATTLFPKQLLHRAQSVEQQLGRKRTMVNGPRIIDIDILLYAGTVMATEELTIPHPRYRERRFVLAPLVDLSPDLKDPETGQSVGFLLERLDPGPACYPVDTEL